MTLLGQNQKTIFLGQGVANPGTSMSDSFAHVPNYKLLELPVAEDMQMGMAIGMALDGRLPVCVFPRWNFLICAANQIINHLDRLSLMSTYHPKVIIRVATPSTNPFNPGPQHDDDFGDAFDQMLRTVEIKRLRGAGNIIPAYMAAMEADRSTILIEYTDFYRNERGNVSNR